MSFKKITTPLSDKIVSNLKIGDKILLSGKIYSARDTAHNRLVKLIEKGESLPFDIDGQVIYFVGPTPARPGNPIGSAGPTTSSRMDAYSPGLMEIGLKGMIGKGGRSREVVDAMVKHGAVYFMAVGGAGALISKCIKKSKVIAYEDLGPEAIMEMEVEDLPVIVINDIKGNDLYVEGVKKYKRQ
ncbi:Fe-S-containing hydro-lyase [Spirochaetota bacterium]